ncbi:hypothetical protein SUGI_0212730 [Cryptomeria japonica]|nr:hypothetical protein SUGI_0212730 [Cryptomeria japonica]
MLPRCVPVPSDVSLLRREEAVKAMSLFEEAQDANRVNAFRERKALALTLNDSKTAVNKLHRMVSVGIAFAIGVIWLLILDIATTHILAQLLLVVFVFGNTCKTIFESIAVFLFVVHPFDVGDRCSVEGIEIVVEEMNILTTVFLRYDHNEKIWYPYNSVLATKPITNFYRSPDMGDAVEFAIHIGTPKEKVDIMKERIKRYVDDKVEHWYPDPMIVVKDIDRGHEQDESPRHGKEMVAKISLDRRNDYHFQRFGYRISLHALGR